MTHGGRRPGAGRKAGAATKRTRAIVDQAVREGVTPLDVILKNMRFYDSRADEIIAAIVAGDVETPPAKSKKSKASKKGDEDPRIAELRRALNLRQLASEDAARAAPFVHARFSAITPPPRDPLNGYDLSKLSDDELDALEAISRKISAAYGDRGGT